MRGDPNNSTGWGTQDHEREREPRHYPPSDKATLPVTLAAKVVGCSFLSDYPSVYLTLAAVVEYGRRPVLTLVHDADNQYDANAVAVRSAQTGRHLCHLPAALAARIAPELDSGARWEITDYEVLVALGHEDNPGLSLNLRRAS